MTEIDWLLHFQYVYYFAVL